MTLNKLQPEKISQSRTQGDASIGSSGGKEAKLPAIFMKYIDFCYSVAKLIFADLKPVSIVEDEGVCTTLQLYKVNGL